jgi:hypothetical protein
MKIALFVLSLLFSLTCFGQVQKKYELYKLFEKNHIQTRTACLYYTDTSGKEIVKDTLEVVKCNPEKKSLHILSPGNSSFAYFFGNNGEILTTYNDIGKKDSSVTKYYYTTNDQGLITRRDWIKKGDTAGYELTRYNEKGKPVEIIKFEYAWTSKFEYTYNLKDSISNYKKYELTRNATGMAFKLTDDVFYVYDSLGRKIKTEIHWWKKHGQEMITTHLYVYDDKSNVIEKKVKDGRLQYTTRYKYDMQGHLIFEANYDLLDHVSYPKSWKYDLHGNVIEEVFDGRKEVYEYNSLDLCIKHTEYNKTGEISRITRYFYEYNQ